jgi:hypothetical protein
MQLPTPQPDGGKGVYLAAALEDRLARQLSETSREIDRAECFDPEQRAEVYAIMEALQTDARAHRRAIRLLSGLASQGDA